jgi:hypothetical protein
MQLNKNKLLTAAAMALFLFAGTGVKAQSVSAPRTLSYQGVLKTNGTAGNITAGIRLLTVTLYGDANGTTKIWQSTMNTPIDSSGVFNCTLGSAENPLPPPATMDRAIWLGVAIDNAPELRPLSEVTASVYAINVADSAITSAKIAAGAVQTANLADGAVTWNKMGTDYVPYIRVNGAKVETGQNSINFTGSEGLLVDYDSLSMSLVFHPDTALASANKGTGMQTQAVLSGGTSTTNTCGTNSDGGVPRNVVSGGCNNVATPTNGGGYATIDGGVNNTVKSPYSTLGGGDDNFIDTLANASFLGGGLTNKIGGYGMAVLIGDTLYLGADVLGGGAYNSVNSSLSALAGGWINTIDTNANYSFIGSGDSNVITGYAFGSAIVAGGANVISNAGSIIGAGGNNKVTGQDAGIISGNGNKNFAADAVIGGGFSNVITTKGGGSIIGNGTNNYANAEGILIGAGANDTVKSYASAVGSGLNATIDSNSSYSFIGAGSYNRIDTASPYSAIVGGYKNFLWGSTSNISGGDTNTIYADSHTAYGDHIGGGLQNTVRASDTSSIVGGAHNYIEYSPAGFIGGGSNGYIYGVNEAAISGGASNGIGSIMNPFLGDYSFIGAGYHNLIQADYSVIGGGNTNNITNIPNSVIAGGDSNFIFNALDVAPEGYSFIGGGLQDTVKNGMAGIVGGTGNVIDTFANYSFIGGGRQNLIQGPWCVIAGGDSNNIYNAGADHNVIGGGLDNIEQNPSFGVIAGGWQNVLDTAAWGSTIGGGWLDSVQAPLSFIGGGDNNTIYYEFIHGGTIAGGQFNKMWYGENSFIGGGEFNHDSSNASVIAGGTYNRLVGGSDYASIGGGQNNVITGAGNHATIPGGDSLIANGYAQTVMGYNNLETVTAVTKADAVAGVAGGALDNPVLIIGNGKTAATPSNAFEISYDGHTTVYDVNGTTPRIPTYGSTYADNTVVAWGEIPAGSTPYPHSITPTAGFGISNVIETAKGQYVIVLNLNMPDGGGGKTLNFGAVTVTAEDNSPTAAFCGFATASSISGNTFTVHIHDTSCSPQDQPFMFMVCGR